MLNLHLMAAAPQLLSSASSTGRQSVPQFPHADRWWSATHAMLSAFIKFCVHSCRNSEGVKADLEDARAAVMSPLSAASMESHARAYPHLVKLHMLGEAADCAALLQEGSLGLGPLERQRRLRWDERLTATHPSLTTQVGSKSMPCRPADTSWQQTTTIPKRAAFNQPCAMQLESASGSRHMLPRVCGYIGRPCRPSC